VEDWPMARLYREAPLNGLWEGSGNVICLDVLRAIAKTPRALEAVYEELAPLSVAHAPLARHLALLWGTLRNQPVALREARRITEGLALALQAALLARHAPPETAEAFIATRLDGEGGRAFGTLPERFDCGAIVARALAC